MRSRWLDERRLESVAPGRVRIRWELIQQHPTTRQAATYDSKLEALRADYWEHLRRAGAIVRWVYHPFSVPLGGGVTYTPDFLIEYPGHLEIEEVKGSRKQKGARDSLTRLKIAASRLPMFRWYLCIGTGFQREEVLP